MSCQIAMVLSSAACHRRPFKIIQTETPFISSFYPVGDIQTPVVRVVLYCVLATQDDCAYIYTDTL